MFFQQMEKQTRYPKEIVIVDGGSSDGSWELMQTYAEQGTIPLRCYQDVGCNVARGRNLAIQYAKHDLIISTDIGCEWDPEWLQELVAPLEADSSVDYVVGSWSVKPDSVHTPWAKTELVLRGHVFIATPEANATSRSVAYRKQAWENVGGYPEDLTLAADDTVFDYLIKKHCIKSAAAPIVRCYWHRFERLQQYLKEEKRNFFGDGEAMTRNNYFVLVGGRLLLEVLGVASVSLLLLDTPLSYLTLVGLLFSLISISHRILKFSPKAQQLAQLGVSFALFHLIAFHYLAKLWALWGYVKGYLHGAKHCQDCRRRLHKPLEALL
ncbi:MAG: glycosyltransferase [Moorea sp. SIO4A1]|nr:glycosyltransferase [Moorena sp. SIO4A1]